MWLHVPYRIVLYSCGAWTQTWMTQSFCKTRCVFSYSALRGCLLRRALPSQVEERSHHAVLCIQRYFLQSGVWSRGAHDAGSQWRGVQGSSRLGTIRTCNTWPITKSLRGYLKTKIPECTSLSKSSFGKHRIRMHSNGFRTARRHQKNSARNCTVPLA